MPQDKHGIDSGAEISRRRGLAAAMIDDPAERKRFIAKQGEMERKRKGRLLETSEYAELGDEAKRVTDKAAAGVPGFSLPTSRRRKREGH